MTDCSAQDDERNRCGPPRMRPTFLDRKTKGAVMSLMRNLEKPGITQAHSGGTTSLLQPPCPARHSGDRLSIWLRV